MHPRSIAPYVSLLCPPSSTPGCYLASDFALCSRETTIDAQDIEHGTLSSRTVAKRTPGVRRRFCACFEGFGGTVEWLQARCKDSHHCSLLYVTRCLLHPPITHQTTPTALTILKIVHQLVLKPFYLSPMRKAPGPSTSPKSFKYVLFGEFPDIMRAEAGILQRQWAKEYGPVVRAVGPFGIERMMFLSPTAMQKILVSDWVEYPRVSGSIPVFPSTTTPTRNNF